MSVIPIKRTKPSITNRLSATPAPPCETCLRKECCANDEIACLDFWKYISEGKRYKRFRVPNKKIYRMIYRSKDWKRGRGKKFCRDVNKLFSVYGGGRPKNRLAKLNLFESRDVEEVNKAIEDFKTCRKSIQSLKLKLEKLLQNTEELMLELNGS